MRDGGDEEELVQTAEKEQPTRYPGVQLKKVYPGRYSETWQMLLIRSGKIRTGREH